MPVIRTYEKKEDISIFDVELDTTFSNYNASHLEILNQVEPSHFWFKCRKEKICQTVEKYAQKNGQILEVGAGTGFIAEELLQRGYDIAVSEIHSNGLQMAKKRGLPKLYQFDLFTPPFYEEFDLVCLFDVLEHLKDARLALTHLRSMVKRGGLLILTVPAHRLLWSHEDRLAGHTQRFEKKELETLLRASSLEPLHIRYFFSAIFPLLLARKWLKKGGENSELKIPCYPLLDTLCYGATKLEFLLDPLLPNFFGGSLIAVAQKKE